MSKDPAMDLSNYCKKHDQHYMRFLHQCPICTGEMLSGGPKTPLGPCNIAEEYIPNKTGLYTDMDAAEMECDRHQKPVQISLFDN